MKRSTFDHQNTIDLKFSKIKRKEEEKKKTKGKKDKKDPTGRQWLMINVPWIKQTNQFCERPSITQPIKPCTSQLYSYGKVTNLQVSPKQVLGFPQLQSLISEYIAAWNLGEKTQLYLKFSKKKNSLRQSIQTARKNR